MVNLDEKIGKTVGRRLEPDPLAVVPGMKEDSRAWKRLAGAARVPKGVFRFKSFEEADEWTMKYLTQPRVNLFPGIRP